MGARTRLLHTIKVNRQFRKFEESQSEKKQNILDDYEHFIFAFIGEDIWNKLPGLQKMFILTKLKEIQETVKRNTIP